MALPSSVYVGAQRVRLNQSAVLGSGGEGTVFRATVDGHPVAVKVYADPTPERAKKLAAMVDARLADKVTGRDVAVPVALATGTNHINFPAVVGFAMPLLGAGWEPLRKLASKKARAQMGASTATVAAAFIDGHESLTAFHHAGLVVGDMNDLNELVVVNGTNDNKARMAWIDVDSWQFGRFPCPVAHPSFLDPRLYGVDLAAQPAFAPSHDWYSFAVLLFRSLLLAHPYGGTHPSLVEIPERASARVTVFDKAVAYPTVAYDRAVLDDGMNDLFERVFAKGERPDPLPEKTLATYARRLSPCPDCGFARPNSAPYCPSCRAKVAAPPPVPTTALTVETVARTPSRFVFSRRARDGFYAIAVEQGRAVLHYAPNSPGGKGIWFGPPTMRGHRYDATQTRLFLAGPYTTIVSVFDATRPGADMPVLACDPFGASGRPVFRAAGDAVYHVLNGTLCRSVLDHAPDYTANWRTTPIRPVVARQTWFTTDESDCDPRDPLDPPVLLGLFQVFAQQRYWFLRRGSFFECPAIAPFAPGERLIDLAFSADRDGFLLRRRTITGGNEAVRTDVVEYAHPDAVAVSRVVPMTADYDISGQVYRAGIAFRATDAGIERETLATGDTAVFAQTRGHVTAGDLLYRDGASLLVVSGDRATRLTLH